MKLTFNRKEFQSALKIGGSYAGSNKVLPILGCVKINVANGKCWITSYDQQNAIKVQCDIIEAEGNIQFCIDYSYIQKYIACLNTEEVELDINLDNLIATITAGTSNTECPIEKADEYPSPVNDKDAVSFKMDASFLLYWMSKGINFVINDEFKVPNECFHLIIKDKQVQFFATQVISLYQAKMDIDIEDEMNISIHKSAYKGLMLALNGEEEVTIRIGKNNIVVICSNKMLLIRKREFNIPDYNKLLRFQPMFRMRVNRGAIIAILQRASLVSTNAKGALVSFEYSDNGVGITTIDYDSNRKMEDFIKAEGGSTYKQNYNIQLLLASIMGISSENVELAPSGDRALLYIYNCDDENELTATCPFA